MKVGSLFALASLVIFTAQAKAAKLSSSCYAPLNAPDQIKGENVEKRIPIASVSKLVTSYWAVKAKGTSYRFQTVIYVTQVSGDVYDIHVQGSRDPYFGAEQLHYTISELNKRGIKKVRNLSYDQNFKFYWFLDDTESNKHIAVGFYLNSDPSPLLVQKQLRAFKSLTQGYEETRNKARQRGIKMVDKIEFSVESFQPISVPDFKPAGNTKSYVVNSVKLTNLLKEMNRNSNNHAANQIFEHLGSDKTFGNFIDNKLSLKSKDIVMLNGSGDRVDTPNGPLYNSASCEAMLKILVDLHKTMKEQGGTIADVATVVGTNPGSATQLYKNGTTYGAVAAKTGTVNPAVTLGGLISTKKGQYVFMFNVAPKGSFGGGRAIIRNKLTQLINDLGGPVNLKASPFSFISFDDRSFSELNPMGTLK